MKHIFNRTLFFTMFAMWGMMQLRKRIMQEVSPCEQIMGKILSLHDAPDLTSHSIYRVSSFAYVDSAVHFSLSILTVYFIII